MLKLPENATIVAPANLHLALYQEIIHQKKNCLNIEVITLQTLIQRYLSISEKSDLQILYEYKDALSSLDRNNAFYDSKEDPAFLSSCLDIIRSMKLWNVLSCPETNDKEKDLKEILELLIPVHIQEDEIHKIDFPSMKHVYLLRQEYPVSQYYWIEQLINKGATWLESEIPVEKHYFTVTTPKTQASFMSQCIIQESMKAEDIFVALSDQKDESVVTQMFDHYQIPYTLLSNIHPSRISTQWISCLKWVQDQSLKNFIQLIQTVYPKEDYILEYLESFPEAFPDFSLKTNKDYVDNEIVNEYDWKHLQALEEKVQEWIQKHDINWSITDFSKMAEVIQNNNTPTDLNRRIFNRVQTSISESLPFIHESKDLDLLIYTIDHISNIASPEVLQGVLIGQRKNISNLRKITFLLSVNAATFPGLCQQSGIFNEAYWSHTELPSFETRFRQQKGALFACLNQPEVLYVITPEMDYERKSIELSSEMNEWMKKEPSFQRIEEYDQWVTTDFSLSQEMAEALFFKDNTIKCSVSQLEAFASCPLKHFLNYGIHLKEKEEWSDARIRGSLIHHILERAVNDHQKDYAHISDEELEQYIQDEFDFVQSCFPSKHYWIQSQKKETFDLLKNVLIQLSSFEQQWHMKPVHTEHKIYKEFKWNQYTIAFTGIIDRVDESSSSFTIFDYKTGDKSLSQNKFESGISLQLITYTLAYQEESKKVAVGSYYIIVKSSPESQIGLKTDFKKKDCLVPYDESTVKEDFINHCDINGWAYQDISNYCEDIKKISFTMPKKEPLKNVHDIEELKEQWNEILNSLFTDIHSGQIDPTHDKGACTFCSYRAICRDAHKEVKKESRLKKEMEETA